MSHHYQAQTNLPPQHIYLIKSIRPLEVLLT